MLRLTYRRPFVAAALGGALLLGACETETKFVPPADAGDAGEDVSVTPDTATPDTSEPDVFPTLKESPAYKWSIPSTPPNRNPACEPGGGTTNGTVIPWTGFIHDGTTYTCNACPNGDPELVGTWRFTYDPDDPTNMGPKGVKETVKFDGNTFTLHTLTTEVGKTTDTTIRGWYFCGLKPEIDNETKTFIVTDVKSTGTCTGGVGECWEPGLLFSAYTLVNGGGGFLWDQFYGFVTSGTGTDFNQPYCRIGTFVGEHPCVDPFAE